MIEESMQLIKRRSIVLIISVLIAGYLSAQNRHSIYVSLGGGASMLLDNGDFTTPKAGGGGDFGFGYELRRGHFLFNVGLEGNYSRMRSYVNDFSRSYDAIDTEGDRFLWKHSFYNRMDDADLVNVNVPVLLGGRYNYVYFLLGPKLSVNVWGRNREQSEVDATAKYEGLLGEFADMENHSLYNGRKLQDAWRNYSTNINLRVAGEVGIPLNTFLENDPGDDVLSVRGIDLRLGIYFEAGVLNLRDNKSSGGLVDYTNVDSWPGVDFTQNYVFKATETKDAYVTDMQIGVRLRVVFGIPEKKTCVICTDSYNL